MVVVPPGGTMLTPQPPSSMTELGSEPMNANALPGGPTLRAVTSQWRVPTAVNSRLTWVADSVVEFMEVA